ncbi:MAG: hypothetical protein KAS72_02210 [Phycisphaerales bacterium]|nr:hypothetical protein [Phycisphaerales bacterium]
MRVLLVTDPDFALREATLVNRVNVGLMGMGIQVGRVVPNDMPSRPPIDLTAWTTYRSARLPWTRSCSAQDVLDDLASQPWGTAPPDIVHAMGAGCWPLALDICREAGGGSIVLDVWSIRLARRLPHARLRRRVSAYLAASQPIGELLRSSAPPNLVRVAPWGVLAPPESEVQPALADPDRSITAVVVGFGTNLQAHRDLCAALATISEQYAQLVVFLAAPPAQSAALHKIIKSFGLESRISLVPQAASARPLILHADLLLLPEASGEHQSLCLEAVAAGMIVIAAADPWVEYFQEDDIAVIVKQPGRDGWSEAIGRILGDPPEARRFAQHARAVVRDCYTASAYIERLADTYQHIVSDEAIAFDTRDGSLAPAEIQQT